MTADEMRHERRKIDRRLLVLYLILVALVCGAVFYVDWDLDRYAKARAEFERAVIINCESNQRNTRALNDLLDGIIRSVQASDNLTPGEKAVRIAFYESGRQDVPDCPPSSVED